MTHLLPAVPKERKLAHGLLHEARTRLRNSKRTRDTKLVNAQNREKDPVKRVARSAVGRKSRRSLKKKSRRDGTRATSACEDKQGALLWAKGE